MGEKIAGTEISRLLNIAIDDLEMAASAHRMNHFVAKLLGAIANSLGHQAIAKRVESLLGELTAEDFFRGAITNIDWRNLGSGELDRLRSIQPANEFDACHPAYDRDSPVPELQRYSQQSPHVRFCLQGEIDQALAAAKTELDYEEIADTLAALGRFDDAITTIDSSPISLERRREVRSIVLMEKCRRLVPGFAEEIARLNPRDYDLLHVVLALAGRRPWETYPYPDY
ncbi:MAG: hypothetical protein AB7G28_22650 [Pirellulales bacterium]